jgi:hypothetical protein
MKKSITCLTILLKLASVCEDALVWKMEYDGVYSVRSAYKHCLNTTGIQDRHGRYCSKLELDMASKNPTKSEEPHLEDRSECITDTVET